LIDSDLDQPEGLQRRGPGRGLTAYLLAFPSLPYPPYPLPATMPIAPHAFLTVCPAAIRAWVDIYNPAECRGAFFFLGPGKFNEGICQQPGWPQMLYRIPDDSSKPIYLYINSPGGSVTPGWRIFRHHPVRFNRRWSPFCVGLGGEHWALFSWRPAPEGKRVALPHSRIHDPQPLGGHQQRQASGTSRIRRARENPAHEGQCSTTRSPRCCGQPDEKVAKDTDSGLLPSRAGSDGVTA